MHSCVQLNVDGKVLYPTALKCRDQRFKSVEVRDSRLKTVLNNLVKIVSASGQNKNRKTDTGLPEFDSLYGKSHGQIVRTSVLHHESELHSTMAVGIGLDKDKEFGHPLEFGAEVPVIAKAILEIKLQTREICCTV